MKLTQCMKVYAVVLFCVVSTVLAKSNQGVKPAKRIKHNYIVYKPNEVCTPLVLSHSVIEPGHISFCGIATVECEPGNMPDNICGFCSKLLVYKAVNGVWHLVEVSIQTHRPACGDTASPDAVIDITHYGHGRYYATWAGYQGCLDEYRLWFDQSRVITY